MTTWRQWQDWTDEEQYEMYQDAERQIKGLKETVHNKNQAIIQLGAELDHWKDELSKLQDTWMENKPAQEWKARAEKAEAELARTRNQALLASEEIGRLEDELTRIHAMREEE